MLGSNLSHSAKLYASASWNSYCSAWTALLLIVALIHGADLRANRRLGVPV